MFMNFIEFDRAFRISSEGSFFSFLKRILSDSFRRRAITSKRTYFERFFFFLDKLIIEIIA